MEDHVRSWPILHRRIKKMAALINVHNELPVSGEWHQGSINKKPELSRCLVADPLSEEADT